MELATFFVLFLITYYTYYIIDMLIHKSKRDVEQKKHNTLETLRAIPAKTLEEQKKFLDIKYPKRKKKKKKFKLTWKLVGVILYTMILYILIFNAYEYLFLKFKIELKLWQAVIFVILFPLGLNIILNKFNLSKSDIGVFLRGSRIKKDK